MRRHTAILAVAMACAILAPSCKKASDKGMGYLQIDKSALFDLNLADITKSSVSEFGYVPQLKDFTLIITDSDNDVWFNCPANEFPEREQFIQGDYTLELNYGTEGEEGFDKARFYYNEIFTILPERTTTVKANVKAANSVLTLKCSDNFNSYYSNAAFTVLTTAGSSIQIKDGQSIFIEPYRFTIKGTMLNPQGHSRSFEKTFESDIKAASHYTLGIDAENIGSQSVSISFNDSVETVDLGKIDIN